MLIVSNANTVPAVKLMLVHLLNTIAGNPTLLPRVRAEVDSVPEARDGTLVVKRLMELPLLQSVNAEVLRLYIDVIIALSLEADFLVPVEHSGDGAPEVRLPKGDVVIVPSWTVRHDSNAWPGVSPNQFDGEWFSVADVKCHRAFSIGSIPSRASYGGRRHMCPWILFAKQELMLAVATVLRMYDLETVGYVGSQGQQIESFPDVGSRLPSAGICF